MSEPAVTDEIIAAILWQQRVTFQLQDWLREAKSLSFPGPPISPEGRLTRILWSLVGQTDYERRRVFEPYGALPSRELQKVRRCALAAQFLLCKHRDRITKEAFLAMRIEDNKRLPKSERRGAGGITHGALQKLLDQGLRELNSRPDLRGYIEGTLRLADAAKDNMRQRLAGCKDDDERQNLLEQIGSKLPDKQS
jgi:hypothetical protein